MAREAKMIEPHERGVAGVLRRRILGASQYSWQGLRACYRYEEAFRVELLLGALLLPVAFWLARSVVELCLLLGAMLVVLIVEVLNSALETAVDLFSREPNELAGRSKDQGSAAVLLSMILFFMVWGFIIALRFTS